MEVRTGYKLTEVGVIPEDWECKQLGEFAAYTNGKAHEQSITDYGKYVVVNSKFISTNGEIRKYSEKSFCEAMRGDILMVMSDVPNGRAIAKCFLVDYDQTYTVNQRICILRPRQVNGQLLFYKLDRNPYYLAFDDGAKQTNLRKNDVLSCRLGIPVSESEQSAIATALSDVDALLDGLTRLIAKKRDLKQATMQQLLTGQTRLPGFSGAWEERRLDELASLYQPQTISANLFTEAGFPVYGANGVVGFYHLYNHEVWQVTVTCRGSTCGTVNRTVDRCWITGNAMVLNCDSNPKLEKEFFYYLMLAQDMSDCITGTGQPQIVRSPLSAFKVRLPVDRNEQTAIATILSDMDTELAALEARLTKTRALKQAMMSELLTGRTRLI